MATKHTDTCLQKAGDNEPIFVLRAQDITAPGLVRMWAILARERAKDQRTGAVSKALDAKLQEAEELAQAMEKWPRRKVPD